jgi:hypothetical protein
MTSWWIHVIIYLSQFLESTIPGENPNVNWTLGGKDVSVKVHQMLVVEEAYVSVLVSSGARTKEHELSSFKTISISASQL